MFAIINKAIEVRALEKVYKACRGIQTSPAEQSLPNCF